MLTFAMERGEVRCRSISVTAFFGREPYITWGKKGFVRPLAQTGKKRDPSLEDVRTIYELMDQYKTPEISRRLATVMLASNIFGRPWLTPPGVPAERVRILREAWNRTVKDTEFLAETKKRRWPVAPVSVATVAVQLVVSLLLLRREFGKRLVPSAPELSPSPASA